MEIFDDIHNQYLIKNENENNKKNKKIINLKKIITGRYNKNDRYKGSCKTIDTYKSKNESSMRHKLSILNSSQKKEELETLLKIIGNSLYKEEEIRNNNIFKKFSKNNFVLSTVKMINNLLSDQFNHVLKKM